MTTVIPAAIAAHLENGALFALNHSGGKDSQAMTIHLRQILPPDQILIIHASLGQIEWPGTIAHIRSTTHGFPMIIARARSDFFAMVRRRGFFPTPAIRQCTSDLKRGPIERELRRYLKAHPRYRGKIVNCLGLRAQESTRRAKRAAVTKSHRNSKAGRDWIDWLPIHDWSEREVYACISAAGERPHWVYAKGMSRCSCSFCIMASRDDLRRAAQLRPALAARYAALEAEIGHTLNPNRVPLPQLTRQCASRPEG